MRALQLLDSELLVSLLKTFKYITMSPAALDTLQHANAIEALVDILRSRLNGAEFATVRLLLLARSFDDVSIMTEG